MHPYIPYLLADIAAAERPELPATTGSSRSIEEGLEEVERWVSGEDPAHTFGYYCGLETVNFPPPEQLTSKEMKMVCKAFKKMMFSRNIDISLPKNCLCRCLQDDGRNARHQDSNCQLWHYWFRFLHRQCV